MNQLLRGNPRLLLSALPFAAAVILAKVLLEMGDWTIFELSPLLAGAISAEVFILGFLLSGTAGDFKEAERLPGEVAAGLEARAVITRPFVGEGLRVTVGTPEEDDVFLAAFDEVAAARTTVG